MCTALHRLARNKELERTAVLLQEYDGFQGEFRQSPLHAKTLAGFYKSKGAEEKRKKWLLEWLKRGGAVSLADNELKSFIDANGEIFEQWAACEPSNVAMFIYLRNEGVHKYLLEKCGKAKAAVSKELKQLLPQQDNEKPDKPEDG